VHIHVDNPAPPLDYAIKAGAILDDIVVENMGRQAEAYAEAASAPLAIVAVGEGAGLKALLRDLGSAIVLEGGAGAKPAAEDFMRAHQQLGAPQVIFLPNDSNIVLAAQQAARLLGDGRALVLPTRDVLQGISALLAYGDALDSGADSATIIEAMRQASATPHRIAISRASRAARLAGLRIGENDYIAFINGELRAAAAELETALLAALEEVMRADGEAELATVYYGAAISAPEAQSLIACAKKRSGDLEFELVAGGQSLYPLLVSVE